MTTEHNNDPTPLRASPPEAGLAGRLIRITTALAVAVLRVARYEHRTSLEMDIGQSDGPDCNRSATFIMTRRRSPCRCGGPGSAGQTPDLPAPGPGVLLQTVTARLSRDARYPPDGRPQGTRCPVS